MKKIKKSKAYKVGVCGIRSQLQDKLKSIDFENDKVIEVTDEQFLTIDALGWCVEVNDGSSTENTIEESKNRVITTKQNK